MNREILLIGGGHAHIEVIRRWGLSPAKNATLSVVDSNPRPIYSGMVPGYVAGQYKRVDLEIDLANLCAKAGARYIRDSVAAIYAKTHCIELSESDPIQYDVASIDIGSDVAGKNIPGVAEFSFPTRPIANLLPQVDQIVEQSRNANEEPAPLHVVGGGAGGVELAFCLDARLRKEAKPNACVEIVTSHSGLLEGATPSAMKATEKYARERGIVVHRHSRVAQLCRDRLVLRDGTHLRSSAAIWATGPAANPLARNSHLPVDDLGFLRVEPSFRIEGQEDLFAVGDCASLAGMKKAGVYAVRAGPIIDTNIRAQLAGAPLRQYQPQTGFLSLLNLGDGEAIGTKWGITIRGRRVMRLKDQIDRSFMEKYR